MTLPQYESGSIVNLMSSIAARFYTPKGTYAPLALLENAAPLTSSSIVLIIIDGLGYQALKQAHGVSSLGQYMLGAMTSVFPSTTATAVTAFMTGVPAQQHGLTGWHIHLEEIAQSAAILPFETRNGGTPLRHLGADPVSLFDYPTFFQTLGVESFAISPDSIAFSEFNRAHTRGATIVPYRSLTQMYEGIERLTREADKPRFVYAYYPTYDSTAHEYGVASMPTRNVLTRVADGFERLLRALAGRGVSVIITADHGFIDAPSDKRIEVEAHPVLAHCLAQPLCGERRLAYCYVKPGRRATFESYVGDALAHACTAVPSARIMAENYFGLGPAHPRLASRIGDYTLLMNDGYTIKDWVPGEKHHTLIGVHGGVTEAEMLVPLIVATP